jgi:hypothetical protein
MRFSRSFKLKSAHGIISSNRSTQAVHVTIHCQAHGSDKQRFSTNPVDRGRGAAATATSPRRASDSGKYRDYHHKARDPASPDVHGQSLPGGSVKRVSSEVHQV